MKELKALREKAKQGEWSRYSETSWLIDGDGNGITEIADSPTLDYIAALHNANLIEKCEELESHKAMYWEDYAMGKYNKGVYLAQLKDIDALKAQLVEANQTIWELREECDGLDYKLASANKVIEFYAENWADAYDVGKKAQSYLQALTTKPKEKEDE